jgi:hypothetical protein
MAEMMVADVLVACDAVECGYRVVELADGRFAFVWGNILAAAGDVLPEADAAGPVCERGVTVHATYEEAEAAYRRCADALSQYTPLGAELLAALGE